jgi:hypothetical protein
VCWFLTWRKTIDRHPVNQHPPAHHPLDDTPRYYSVMDEPQLPHLSLIFHFTLVNQFYEK